MMRALRQSGHMSELGRVFLIGFGNIGKATAYELLKLNLDKPIDVYDKNWKIRENDIKKIGANMLKKFPKVGAYNTLLGCTGEAAIHDMKQLKILASNSVLVSGSSAAIEFNREKFIDHAYESDTDDFYVIEPEKTRTRGLHTSIRMHLNDTDFSFLNAGFPANFDGSIECVPALLIQPTHGMLLAAAYEALGQRPGLTQLNEKYDNWFFTHGLKWVKRYAESTECS
jgi:hypothetical protein